MKKTVLIAAVAAMCLSSTAFAAEGLEVKNKNYLELSGQYTSDNAYFFAKVENVSGAPVTVGKGSFVGFSSNDEILVNEDYVFTVPTNVTLEPGEYAYIREYMFEKNLESDDVVDYKFSLSDYEYSSPDEFDKIANENTYELNASNSGSSYAYVTLTNDTDETRFGYYICIALLDAEGNVLYVDYSHNTDIGVGPHSTVTYKVYIDSGIVEYFEQNNITPASCDSLVYYEK